MCCYFWSKNTSVGTFWKQSPRPHYSTSQAPGIAFQVDVEDAIGVMRQVEELTHEIEDKI
jgi:hypothetical protein